MIILWLIVFTCVLLVGFLVLTSFEMRAEGQNRLFHDARTKFDRFSSRLIILATHVDYGSFFRHLTKDIVHKVAHDAVEMALSLVRFLERSLAGSMKSLRSRLSHPHVEMTKEGSKFVKTITYFKKTIRKSEKEGAPTTTELPPEGN